MMSFVKSFQPGEKSMKQFLHYEDSMKRLSISFLTIVMAIVTGNLCILRAYSDGEPKSVPILYSTDLFHPHDDPDDHFDLMTLFSIPEFDIRAIVNDIGPQAKGRTGALPVSQMTYLTGRKVPYTCGLTENLKSPEDKTENQPAEAQKGVELIVKVLREATGPVTLFTTGSLRDMAAAYNREPELFKSKVARFYVNAGHSGGEEEWNVKLDRNAFVRILQSDLPVYWLPCFGTNGYSSYWKFRQGAVLESAPIPIQNFVIYALTKSSPLKVNPLIFLTSTPSDEVKKKLWAEERNMWCTAAFLHAAGRSNPTYTFETIKVHIDERGVTRITNNEKDHSIRTFHCNDPKAYAVSMREELKRLVSSFKLVK